VGAALTYCMMYYTLFALLAVSVIGSAAAGACTDDCDRQAASALSLYSGNVSFCGTDRRSYNTFTGTINAFTSVSCYSRCGVSVLYPGTCACPNFCNSEFNQGTCNGTGCNCLPGWGGADCSLVVCATGNTCSGHGTCTTRTPAKGGDVCACNNGWTSADCSTAIPSALSDKLPFGEIFPGPFYANDKYGDDHPVMNTSLVATIRLTVAAEDLIYILNPANAYNQSDVNATFFFFNGVESQVITNISMHIKGALSRVFPKKSYSLKFGKGNSYKKLKGLGLKASNGDRIISNQLLGDFYRSMHAYTYRMSMAELWVNNVFFGMYTMQEKIDDNFEESRFNASDANLYKMAIYDLQNLGSDPAAYQNYLTPIYDVPQQGIEQDEGNGSYSDIVEFAQAVNSPSSAVRSNYLLQHFDVQQYLRSLALEAITRDIDGYSSTGNNWVVVDKNTANGAYWKWVKFDFDGALDGLNLAQEVIAQTYFGINASQLNQAIDLGLVTLPPGTLSDLFPPENPFKLVNRPGRPKPLNIAVFELPGANATYTADMKAFLQAVYIDKHDVLLQRYQAYYFLARPSIIKDLYSRLDGSSVGLYDTATYKTFLFFESRFGYLSTLLFPACIAATTCSGNGICNGAGACVCAAGFTGAACDRCLPQHYGPQCAACTRTAAFNQVLVASWPDNSGNTASQWEVTLQVGGLPLYAVDFTIIPQGLNHLTSIWNANYIAASSIYRLPQWQYQSGVIPANSQSVKFGYIITGSQSANITFVNNFCLPPTECGVSVSPHLSTVWTSNGILYQQYFISIQNTGERTLANVEINFSLAPGSSIGDSFNLAPSSNPSNRVCSTWNLERGGSSSSCGYTIKTPAGTATSDYVTTSVVQPVCI